MKFTIVVTFAWLREAELAITSAAARSAAVPVTVSVTELVNESQ